MTERARAWWREALNDAGERFWLLRAGDGDDPGTGLQRWFLQGVFG